MSRLSQHQLRWISAAGMGLLVGTSLIVVIPEGMETLYFHDVTKHTYATRFPIQRQEGMVDGATTGHSDPKNNFWAGTALIVGFGLMYLIDRIPSKYYVYKSGQHEPFLAWTDYTGACERILEKSWIEDSCS